jgi:hypothetical protein
MTLSEVEDGFVVLWIFGLQTITAGLALVGRGGKASIFFLSKYITVQYWKKFLVV